MGRISKWNTGRGSLAGSVAGGVMMLAISAAGAATVTMEDRYSVVAGGQQLDRQCEHLGAAERDELREIAAHVEVEAAKEIGGERVREIRAGAREFADQRGADCGEETSAAVALSLEVARDYAVARTQVAERAEARRQRQEAAAQQSQAVQPETRNTRREPQPELSAELDRFGAQTHAYYLQRRCGHLPYNQAVDFWKLVAHKHKAFVRRFGARAIGRMQRAAEAGANDLSCSSRTRRIVHNGYATLQRDIRHN